MNGAFSAGRWRALVLTAWVVGLALLLGFGRYSLFIRAQLWPLALCNVLILLLFLIAMAVRPVHGGSNRISPAGFVRGGMLLLPLLYMSSLLSGAAASGLNSFALGKRSIRKVAIDQPDRAAAIRSDRSQRRPRLGIARADHDRHAGLDDAALLGRDRGNRIAQALHVIETDWRDHAEQRPDHVGRVEPAAESGLDHRRYRRRPPRSTGKSSRR